MLLLSFQRLFVMMIHHNVVSDDDEQFTHCSQHTHTREAYNVAMLLSLKAFCDDDDHHIHHNVVGDYDDYDEY